MLFLKITCLVATINSPSILGILLSLLLIFLGCIGVCTCCECFVSARRKVRKYDQAAAEIKLYVANGLKMKHANGMYHSVMFVDALNLKEFPCNASI
jgi:hypothetical protein